MSSPSTVNWLTFLRCKTRHFCRMYDDFWACGTVFTSKAANAGWLEWPCYPSAQSYCQFKQKELPCKHRINSGTAVDYLVQRVLLLKFEASSAPLCELLVLQCLVSDISWKDPMQQNAQTKDTSKLQYLVFKVGQTVSKPNFASLLCQTLEALPALPDDFMKTFPAIAKLSIGAEITLALMMAKSLKETVRMQGNCYFQKKKSNDLPGIEGLQTRISSLSSSPVKLPESLTQCIAVFLYEEKSLSSKPALVEALKSSGNPTYVLRLFCADSF